MFVTTGNTVRAAVLKAAETAYAPSGPGEPFRLVVFGGSQGAQYFSAAIPNAVSLLEDEDRSRLVLTQQARPEDKDKVTSCFAKLGAPADISPFFTDMAERIAAAHLVICRSGASTVSEISVIGRPSVLVPYPYALDHDQAANAASLAAHGGAKVIPQAELTPERLASIIKHCMHDPDKLSRMAAAAKKAGRPNATQVLADMVEAVAAGQSITQFKGARA